MHTDLLCPRPLSGEVMNEVDSSGIFLPCSRCKQVKPIDQFRRRPNRSENGKRRGRWSHCHDCERERQLSPRGREIGNAASRRFLEKLRKTNLPELRRRQREANLRKQYGIGHDQYEEILKSQGGKCAICGGGPNGKHKDRFHIDHDHETEKIRGLLCGMCNLGVGYFYDDPVRLRNAAAYLERDRS